MLPVREVMSWVQFKVQLLTVVATMKQARLNSPMLLSMKYEEMFDGFDLNSVAKARQIIYSLIIITAQM